MKDPEEAFELRSESLEKGLVLGNEGPLAWQLTVLKEAYEEEEEEEGEEEEDERRKMRGGLEERKKMRERWEEDGKGKQTVELLEFGLKHVKLIVASEVVCVVIFIFIVTLRYAVCERENDDVTYLSIDHSSGSPVGVQVVSTTPATPHHTAPHRTTPYHTTPHHTTPHHTILHHTTPHLPYDPPVFSLPRGKVCFSCPHADLEY